jgi:hypothetical protein
MSRFPFYIAFLALIGAFTIWSRDTLDLDWFGALVCGVVLGFILALPITFVLGLMKRSLDELVLRFRPNP